METPKKTKNLQHSAKIREISLTEEYRSTLADLKKRIRESQLKATVAVSKELLLLYWTIGKTIVEKQEKSS